MRQRILPIRGNDTHQFVDLRENDVLVLQSLDDWSLVEISRDDLGDSLQPFDSTILVSMGFRTLQRDGKWEIAMLNP